MEKRNHMGQIPTSDVRSYLGAYLEGLIRVLHRDHKVLHASCPLDKRIKDRQARIQAKDRTQTGIHRVQAMQCFILSSRC